MKKVLKVLAYLFAVILILLIGVTAYFYYGFNNYSLEDNYTVNTENLAYFNDSYEHARQAFRAESNKLKQQNPETAVFSIPVKSNIDTNLTIDFCFIPAKAQTDKLLILSSGVHGAEGYVGSGVQLFFMDKYLNTELLNETSVLLIHSVNPFGFKYSRRVTENNIDLNRNSDIDLKLYETKNTGYEKVYDLINPKGFVETESMANKFFFAKAIKEIAKKTMPVLRQAVLQGQYSFPEGLYYGGNNFEPQIKDLAPIIDTICLPYKTILAIDLHTGYGARGKLHLFPNPVDEDLKKQMETIFKGFQIDWGDSGDFYTITGDFVSYIGKINKNKTFIPMTFEYGTMDSQTTMGSLKSIHIMILENQGQQYGYATDKDSLKVKKDIVEMYYPSSEAWRSNVIDETKKLFDSSLKQFNSLK